MLGRREIKIRKIYKTYKEQLKAVRKNSTRREKGFHN